MMPCPVNDPSDGDPANWNVQFLVPEKIVKFVLVSALSLVLTLAVCELVRFTPVTRLLFGIKSRVG